MNGKDTELYLNVDDIDQHSHLIFIFISVFFTLDIFIG